MRGLKKGTFARKCLFSSLRIPCSQGIRSISLSAKQKNSQCAEHIISHSTASNISLFHHALPPRTLFRAVFARSHRRGRRPRRPATPPFPPTFRHRIFAFSCGRRGTAERWMRSNALPYNKTSTEGKDASFVILRLPPSLTGEGISVTLRLLLPSSPSPLCASSHSDKIPKNKKRTPRISDSGVRRERRAENYFPNLFLAT